MYTNPNLVVSEPEGVVINPLPSVPQDAELVGVDSNLVQFSHEGSELCCQLPVPHMSRVSVERYPLELSSSESPEARILVPDAYGQWVVSVEVVRSNGMWFSVARPLKGEEAKQLLGGA